ncbi:MAG: hypothetical protein HAW63_02960 [Bdellovibrionaceae bacterium]|nr:hypothetical protein [Pseudobdellovibrionaceae bacterium]
MRNSLKKQKNYFISLGVLGLILVGGLVLFSFDAKESSIFSGSSSEAHLTECSLEDCSKAELEKKLFDIQTALNSKKSEKLTIKLSNKKLNIFNLPLDFKKQLIGFDTKLNQLRDSSKKLAEKNYNSYLVAILNQLQLVREAAIKKLRVSDFENTKKAAIKKYVNLNINLNQIKSFLLDHLGDLTISYPSEKYIDRMLLSTQIDQELLTALLNEHQSRNLAITAEKEQKKNTDDPLLQVKNNSDIWRSINLHQRAQSFLFSLQRHKQNGAFKHASHKKMLESIKQAEKYLEASNAEDIKFKYKISSNSDYYHTKYKSDGYNRFSTQPYYEQSTSYDNSRNNRNGHNGRNNFRNSFKNNQSQTNKQNNSKRAGRNNHRLFN